MKNQKIWIAIAGFLGFAGAALGAFGAHRLADQLNAEMLDIYKTGIFYHLIHTVVILAMALYGDIKFFKSALMFVIGIILFSFSLYIYAITGAKFFAMVTPVGGIFLLIGWALIIYVALKYRLK